jgi:aspartyl-tRNA synthetase
VAEQPIPLDLSGKIESNLDKRLDWRVLDLRRPEVKAIFTIRSEFLRSYREYMSKQGFIEFNSPKVLETASESGSNVFPIIYFQREAFLAQSPQFYKQSLIAAGFDRVFETGPVFRAEPHHTTRHTCEYTSLDFEMGFIKSYDDIMKLSEGVTVHMLKSVAKNCADELKLLGKKIDVPKTPFPRVTMEEAYELLEKEGYKPEHGDDLSTEHEKALGDIVKKKFKHDFVFLTQFPWKVRPFYAYKNQDNPKWTDSYDLIYKGIEMVTGGQREHRYDVLVKQAKEKGIHLEPIKWYADMFKYGVPPHGGQGLGLGRIVKQFLELDNIREAVMYPRDPDRLAP